MITAQDVAKMIRAGGIERAEGGSIVITGQGLELASLLTLKGALGLESKGIRMSRNFSALVTARDRHGIKARTAAKAHEILTRILDEGRELAKQ